MTVSLFSSYGYAAVKKLNIEEQTMLNIQFCSYHNKFPSLAMFNPPVSHVSTYGFPYKV